MDKKSMRQCLGLVVLIGLALAVLVGGKHALARAFEPGVADVRTGNLRARYDWLFDGEERGDELGFSVGTAGDVNGDGWDDAIVGAPKATHSVTREGVAYLFYGSGQGLQGTVAWKAGGGLKGSEFGAAVGAAGDVNGDDYADVIVGAPLYGQQEAGRVFVFYGSGTVPGAAANWTYEIGQANARFGVAVGTAGDVNGDGWDDVIVGAQGYSNDQVQEGAVFVFYGSPSGPITSTLWLVEGDQASVLFGASVGTAGDVNGDGYDDVIVGAPQYGTDQDDEGAAFVFYGSEAGLSTSHDWMVSSNQAGAEFGASVGAAGDVNNDGYGDVIVGAPHYNGDQTNAGAAFVFLGSAAGLGASAAWSTTGDQEGSGFGAAVGRAGDMNGDGYDDVIVGAYRYAGDQAYEGGAFVYLGSAAGPGAAAGWTAEGNKAETEFGAAVGAAGDVNRDGYEDVIVGAPQYRIATDLRGRAFAYHGAADLQGGFSIFLPLISRDF